MRKIWRKHVRQSWRKVSGKPALLPIQSRPSLFTAPDAFIPADPAGASVGNALGSWILPFIHLWTRWMYCGADTGTGSFLWSSQVYVWLSKVRKTLSPHTWLDNPTVQQPFWGRNRSCTLIFQCYDLPPGYIVQWSRQCDNSQQLYSYALASPWSKEILMTLQTLMSEPICKVHVCRLGC